MKTRLGARNAVPCKSHKEYECRHDIYQRTHDRDDSIGLSIEPFPEIAGSRSNVNRSRSSKYKCTARDKSKQKSHHSSIRPEFEFCPATILLRRELMRQFVT